MASSTRTLKTPWILSRTADCALIVGAPLLCVAIVLPLAAAIAPASLWLAVMAFGAVGHHLPGFLRTYGDRELFGRYRWRFILAPPLVLMATLAFALNNLHGIALVALVWSIWHGMMQHYGFLRIYDAKVRAPRPAAARLDFAMSLSWFATCLLLGPHQSSSILDALIESGFPPVPAGMLRSARILAVAATIGTTVFYVAATAQAIRRGERVSWNKLALLATTTALVWFARVVTRDPFISVVLFEVLHDVQYLAIVWAFNHRVTTSHSSPSRVSRALFAPRAHSVIVYVGACLAYGAIAFFTYRTAPEGTGKTVLVALLVTSGILHYYYDGFIWKLRRPETRVGLALDDSQAAATQTRRSLDRAGLIHAALFGAAVVVAGGVEAARTRLDALDAARAIVDAVPDSPTAQYNLAAALFERGDVAAALPHLREATRLQPSFAMAHAKLGDALFRTRDISAAEHAYQRAIALGGDTATVRANLGYARIMRGDIDAAEQDLRAALALDARSFGAHLNLAIVLNQRGRMAEAIEHLQVATRLRPDVAEVHNNLGAMLLKAGRTDEAIVEFRTALRIDPDFEPARHNLTRIVPNP